jgi:hypothetical protein
MLARPLQIFSLCWLLVALASAEATGLAPGSLQHLVFRDVDGNDLSTSDGHVTIVTVITRDNEEEAHAVADQVPDRYKGDPKYRYVTLVNFQRKLFGLVEGVTRAVIRHRLDAEAKEIKPDYVARKITRDPRRDLHVIADFDGQAVQKLGLPMDRSGIAVFVFNGQGKLVARWNKVPPGDSLAKAIVAAE